MSPSTLTKPVTCVHVTGAAPQEWPKIRGEKSRYLGLRAAMFCLWKEPQSKAPTSKLGRARLQFNKPGSDHTAWSLVLTPPALLQHATGRWFKALNQQKLNPSQAKVVCDSSAMGHLTPAVEHQCRRGGKRGRPAPCQHQPPSSCTLSPSRFCLRLEKDAVETQGMCLLLTLISAAPLSLISQC